MARVELLVTVDKIVTSNLQPVSGGSVQVNVRSTGTPATVYAAETGGTTVSNPLVTDAQGRVNGWVDEESYVLNISGSGITSYNQPYEAVRGSLQVAFPGDKLAVNTMPGDRILNASIPNTKLANGAVLGKHLSEGALPLGAIISYWVPAKPGGGYAVPDGWAVCNGQALGPGSHDFVGGGTVTLPNLIDKVPRGTDPTVAYNAVGGMNALAGANTLNLAHTHTIAHTHNIAAHSHTVTDHLHYVDHSHSAWVPDHAHGLPYTIAPTGSGNKVIVLNGTGTYGFGGVGIGTSGSSAPWSGAADRALVTTSQSGGTITGASNTADSGSSLGAATDTRNASVGVLYLIKVKNTV
jgi:hypothetical protein